MGLILEQTGGQNFNEPVTLRNFVEYSYMWNRCAKYYDRFEDVQCPCVRYPPPFRGKQKEEKIEQNEENCGLFSQSTAGKWLLFRNISHLLYRVYSTSTAHQILYI